MVRAAGIDADPTSCNASEANTEATIQACLASIGSVDGPFASFENPYDPSRTGDTTIRGQLSSSTISTGVTECTEIDAGAEAGDVLVSVSGTLIQTHYCVPSEDSNVLLTKWIGMLIGTNLNSYGLNKLEDCRQAAFLLSRGRVIGQVICYRYQISA